MPMPLGHQVATIEARFWAKVAWTLEGWAERTSPCWPWTGGKSTRGYARIGLGGRGGGKAFGHRLAYELERGPIPNGLVLDHLCRNTSCCNPWHLEPVTQGENVRRARALRLAEGMGG